MMSLERQYVLTLGCPDRAGIVARIAGFLAESGAWITEAAYYADPDTNWFFTRQVVRADSVPFDLAQLRRRFAAIATDLGGQTSWKVTDTGRRQRVVILVSREAHCLYDLLGRVSSGELNVDVPVVISNHADLADITRAHGITFQHLPFPLDQDGKAATFAQLQQIVDSHRPDAVVLARFMQILPHELCAAWAGVALNIHHSFLPSFAGARAYFQAHTRGVKLIGATCHYVTAELDAGPIVEQDVIRVDHNDTVADMVRKGRDIEKVVLARGLRWHLEERVLVHGNRTVIFT